MSGGTNPEADGITFMIQNSSLSALGGFGGDLGYTTDVSNTGSAIDNSLAVEFDTFANTEVDGSSANHVAVLENGNNGDINLTDPGFALAGGTTYAWINYDAASHLLSVFASRSASQPATPLLSLAVDLPSLVGSAGFIGFSGGTGSATAVQTINNWLFSTQATEVNDGTTAAPNGFEKVDFANKTNATVTGDTGSDTITINNPLPGAGLTNLDVVGGAAGADNVTVLTTPASVVTSYLGNGPSSGPDSIVNVGVNHSVQGILGTLNLQNFPARNQIVVDDSADPVGQNVVLQTFSPNNSAGSEAGRTWGKIQALAPGDINYVYNDFDSLTIDGGTGGNTFTVDDTGGDSVLLPTPTTTTINAGTGDDTFTIAGDNLSGNNYFNGQGGNDRFFLNIAQDLGANGFTPLSALVLAGNATAGAADVNRNQVIVNDNSGSGRALNFVYQDSTAGDLNIAPLASGSGLGGSAADIALQLQSVQTLIFNTASAQTNNDQVQITGTSGDDLLTVAELPMTAAPSGPANALLPNGTVIGASVTAFLGGQPYLKSPPTELTNISGAHNLPGVAGGGAGPDLLINGISGGGLTLDGGGNSSTAGRGDQAIVYAASEGDLVDNTTGSLNIFGLGAGVLQKGFGGGNAYDDIGVSDSLVWVGNNELGNLVSIHLNTATFAQAGPASATQQPGLIVNGGDESSFQSNGVADSFAVAPSRNFNIQVNGNQPALTADATTGEPQGDELLLPTFDSSVDVFSDGATVPNVTVTGNPGVDGPFGVAFSSIERVNLSPGNGVVNMIGDNSVAGGNQDDYFKVRGGIDPLGIPTQVPDGEGGFFTEFVRASDGRHQFSLKLGGSWDPATGAVGIPDVAGLQGGGISSPLYFYGVTRINAAGGAAASFDTNGNALPDTSDPAGVNALDITPYANNTPQGWGIETYYNQGNPVPDGGVPNPDQDSVPVGSDLLVYNAVAGVSDNIVVQPSGPQAGQLYDNNAASNTSVAIVNYANNTNIIVNGNDGTLGDTDNLFLKGTDPANAGTSGNDLFDVDLTRTGTAADELVRVTDSASSAPLYNIQNFTNFNTLNINTLGGRDTTTVVGRQDGSVPLNVVSSSPLATVRLLGTTNAADLFEVGQGGTNGTTTAFVLRAGNSRSTTVNVTGAGHLGIDGGGGTGRDTVVVFGTTGNDSFTVRPTDATDGSVTLAGYPSIDYSALGVGTGAPSAPWRLSATRAQARRTRSIPCRSSAPLPRILTPTHPAASSPER